MPGEKRVSKTGKTYYYDPVAAKARREKMTEYAKAGGYAPTRRTGIEEYQAEIGESGLHVSQATTVEERLRYLYNDFPAYVLVYDRSIAFTKSQLDAHLDTLRLRKKLGTVRNAVCSEVFADSLWATLVAWRMNRGRKGGGLMPPKTLARTLKTNVDIIEQLEDKKIDALPQDEIEPVTYELWQLIQKLQVSATNTQIVAGTKALRHILPELVPPIDRKMTGSFFGKRPQAFQGIDEQEKLFRQFFRAFVCLAQKTAPRQYVGDGWRTSVTKIIDNAIIGFGLKHPEIVYKN